MFNPLAPLDQVALDAFVTEGHRFFVRQTFSRAKDHFDESIKGCFLFCHYKTGAAAREHYDALANDPNRFLYDWDQPAHREKLLSAAARPPGYKLYTNTFMPDWERHITKRIQQKIGAYIRGQGWKPDRNETIQTYFYPHFGEVMIGIKFRKQELRIKFEEIEKRFL